MTARDLARRALWSEHPLCLIYALANGQWIGGRFVPCGSWSLRELAAFAERLPADVVRNLARGPA